MITDDHRALFVGDHVQFSDTTSTNVTGVVVELLQNDYVRVRWPDLPGTTTHRAHGLTVVPADRSARIEHAAHVHYLVRPKPPSDE